MVFIKNKSPWNKGLKTSEETRKKLSESHKGQTPWNKGISPSIETRKKISKKLKGQKLSEETKRKISFSLIGNTHTKGKCWSEENKAKLKGRKAWNKGIPISQYVKETLFKTNWKGGKINHDGYIRIRCDGHPRATNHGKYVLEHILIIEKNIGRYLNPNEVVHHINGIKNDNRIENLIVLTQSIHAHLHHAIKRK